MSNMLDTAFDVPNEEGTPPITLLPAGNYTAEITSASVGETKNRKGTAVSLGLTITEGDYEKRMVFANILIQHESAEAQRFGRQKMKDVCVACGIIDPLTNLDVLLYKACQITVAIRKDESGNYADRNEVKRVAPVVASWNGPKPGVEDVDGSRPERSNDDPEGIRGRRRREDERRSSILTSSPSLPTNCRGANAPDLFRKDMHHGNHGSQYDVAEGVLADAVFVRAGRSHGGA